MSHFSVEELLEHADWMRRLARHLASDPASAEDLVQDTWVAALKRPPHRDAPARPWLVRVMRNLARNDRRSQERRKRREAERIEPTEELAPDQITLEIEGQRLVVDELARIEDPFRTALVMRYFRGLDPPAIARELGLTAGTVRWRIARGLELLRERLDRRTGDRSTWLSLLAPSLALPTESQAGAGGTAVGHPMIHVAATSLLVIAAAAGAFRLAFPGAPVPPARPAAVGTTPLARAGSPTAEPLAQPTAGARAPAPSVPATMARLESDGFERTLRGRFVFPDASAAQGVRVVLEGRSLLLVSSELYAGSQFESVTATTDVSGAFELVFHAPPGFRFRMRAERDGYVHEDWSWMPFVRPGVEDLGTFALRVPGVVEGTIRDESGAPLTGIAWQVTAREVGPRGVDGHGLVFLGDEVDPGTAFFRFEGLPAGQVTLGAQCPLASRLQATATVVAGEATRIDLVHSGADLARRVVVAARSRAPFSGFVDVDVGAVRLLDVDGAALTPQQSDNDPNSFVFDGLEPGSFRAEVNDPRFLPWNEEGIEPGAPVSAQLVGSASLVVDARDSSGVPVALDEVGLESTQQGLSPSYVVLAAGGEHFDGTRIAGLVPGGYRLSIEVPGGRGEERVEDLAAGEQRVVSIVVAEPSSARLAGTVRDATGTPVAAVEVLLVAPAQVDDSPSSVLALPGMSVSPAERYRTTHAVTTSASDGRFAFEAVESGTWLVHARTSRWRGVTAGPYSVAEGADVEDAALVLPSTARLSGRVIAPPGVSCEGVRLAILPAGALDDPRRAFGRLNDAKTLDADGSFTLDGLDIGPSEPWILLPRVGGRTRMTVNRGHWLGSRALAPLNLVPGHNEAELDARGVFPATAGVDVVVGGERLPGAIVELTAEQGSTSVTSEGVTSTAGPARWADFPGTLGVRVWNPDRTWCWVDSQPLVLEPGGTAERTIHVELATATLRLRGPDGTPRPGVVMQLVIPGEPHPLRVDPWRATDATGALELTLPAGTPWRVYELGTEDDSDNELRGVRGQIDKRNPEPPRAEFVWGAGGAEIVL